MSLEESGGSVSFEEAPTRRRRWWITYIVSQVGVRALFLLALYAAFVNTGALDVDGTITKRGTAVATACDRVGPVSRSGIGWYWQCEAEVTWQDGTTGKSTFTGSELTPQNRLEPVPVAWREVDKRGHEITVEGPRPFATFGWLMVVPLLALVFSGVRVPGVPPLPPEERAEHRRKRRLQLWQPLMMPLSWGLLIAGGLATAAPSVFPGAAVVTIVMAYLALVTMSAIYRHQRRHGVPEPAVMAPESASTCLAGGHFFRVLGVLGVVLGVPAAFGNWLGLLGVVAIPLVMAVFGQRMVVVAKRHRRQSDGTGQAPAAS